MKREIKFRGKRIDTGQWVYGSYHPHNKVLLCIASKEQVDANRKALIIQDGMSDWNLSIPINTHEVFPESVGEFTGLKGKNGKEIYEGAICKYKDPKGYDSELWEVIFYMGAFRLAALPSKIRIYDIGICYDIEVIGNIYENPELI